MKELDFAKTPDIEDPMYISSRLNPSLVDKYSSLKILLRRIGPSLILFSVSSYARKQVFIFVS